MIAALLIVACGLNAQTVFPPDGSAFPDGWVLDESRSNSSLSGPGAPPPIDEVNEWYLHEIGGISSGHSSHGDLPESSRWLPVGWMFEPGWSNQATGIVEPAKVDVRAYCSGSFRGGSVQDQGSDSAIFIVQLDAQSYDTGTVSGIASVLGDLNTKAQRADTTTNVSAGVGLEARVEVKMDVSISAGGASARAAIDARSAVVADPTSYEVSANVGPFGVPILPISVAGLSEMTHHYHASNIAGLAAQSQVVEAVVAFNADASFRVEASKAWYSPRWVVVEAEAKADVTSKASVALGATKRATDEYKEDVVVFEVVQLQN